MPLPEPVTCFLLNREDLERREHDILAPYAVFSDLSRGREHPSNPAPFRTCFQQDRDRITHSSAFRRLEYKTQVFVNHEGDYYRTRLTHTLEAAQIARSVARNLRLNEDLAEAAALAHDLGHTPFGHAGQDVMNELMKEHGGFEHNQQSLRIVDLLENRTPTFPGLNLTVETREAIAKHSPRDTIGFPQGWPSLEGQLVDIVDSIAYLAADIDDGLHSGLLDLAALSEVELVSRAMERVRQRISDIDFSKTRRPFVSEIISLLVSDLTQHTAAVLQKAHPGNLEDVRQSPHKLVGFSDEVARIKGRTHVFLMEHFYSHPKVKRMALKAHQSLEKLFEIYTRDPGILPYEHQAHCEAHGVERAVCDYIAGMTDRFALGELEQLTGSTPT